MEHIGVLPKIFPPRVDVKNIARQNAARAEPLCRDHSVDVRGGDQRTGGNRRAVPYEGTCIEEQSARHDGGYVFDAELEQRGIRGWFDLGLGEAVVIFGGG